MDRYTLDLILRAMIITIPVTMAVALLGGLWVVTHQ